MIGPQSLMLLAVGAWFLAGGAVEVVNSLTRQWTVRQLGLHGHGRLFLGLIVGFLLRLSVTSLVLLLAFRHNVVSGVAALTGYWICRWLILWRLHRRVSSKSSQISG